MAGDAVGAADGQDHDALGPQVAAARAAGVSTAIWSPTPSTSTTARASSARASARAVASVAAAGPVA
ncbi:hypothetical protein [Saccharothrix xinjiangensis]|uniref:Uncharacterized protein n=1 Tax=Saccharothrix xinjiangensis TaxID=204798 RepID=A0ABV9Y2B9_9PSEU